MSHIRWNTFLLDALCIMTLCTVIYGSSLHGDFVYDDFETIVKNPYIKDLKYVPHYFNPNNTQMWSFHESQRQFYRPALLVSFALNYHISRLDPFSYHLVNLILHIINSLLVYKAVRYMVKLLGPLQKTKPPDPRKTALITALLFASHPIQTEAVSYIVSRSSLLSTFFILCSFTVFLLAIEKNNKGKFYKIISLLFFVLGLFTKEIPIVVPLLVLGFSMLYLKPNNGRIAWYGSIRTSLPYFIVVIIYLAARISMFGKSNLVSLLDIFIRYFLSAVKGLFVYLKLLIFPVGQSVDHFLPIIKTPWEPTAILAFVALLVIVWFLVARVLPYSKVLFFFAVWFAIAIMPNLVLPSMEPISEHSVYFPSLGFFAATGFLFLTLWNRCERMLKGPSRIACIGLFFILIMQLGMLTINRNLVWQDSLSLWKDAVRKAPNKARPHQNLGNAYHQAGMLDLAVQEFQTVLSLDPENPGALNNLGIIWTKTGDYKNATKAFNNSISLQPFNPEALNNLGLALMIQGRIKAAIPILEKSLRMNPDDAVTYTNLGWAYYKTDNKRRGCECLESATRLDPDHMQGVELYRRLCSMEHF